MMAEVAPLGRQGPKMLGVLQWPREYQTPSTVHIPCDLQMSHLMLTEVKSLLVISSVTLFLIKTHKMLF